MGNPKDPSRRRILVVDDNEVVLEAFPEALERRGFVVECASTVKEARALFEELDGWGGALVDVAFHGEMSGLDLMDDLREADRDLWVVLHTGYAIRMDVRSRAIAANAGVFEKPTQTSVFVRWLESVHMRSASEAEPIDLYIAAEPTLSVEMALSIAVEQYGLSPRQTQVLRLMVMGVPRARISDQMDITENTFRNHVSAIRKRSGRSIERLALEVLHLVQFGPMKGEPLPPILPRP